MKKKRFYLSHNQKEIALNILRILAAGIVLSAAIVAPNAIQILKVFSDNRKSKIKGINGNHAWKVIKKLQQEKIVRISQQTNQTIIEITKKGKTEFLKFDLEKMIINKPAEWDGTWRVVIFDIPENKKEAREAFRNLLKRLEFYQLQKSVFIHPHECKKEISFIKEIYEINPFVTYLKVKEIDDEEILKNRFGL